MMQLIPISTFQEWLSNNSIQIDNTSKEIAFSQEFMFRIPIGDYHLQLDYRIDKLFELIPNTPHFVCTKDLKWNFHTIGVNPKLEAILEGIGVVEGEHILHFEPDETSLVKALVYLTNRWGCSSNSLYVFPKNNPMVMFFVPGSPESVFVISSSQVDHDKYVDDLKQCDVPAFGPFVKSPIPLPVYHSFEVGSGVVTVDPDTGKLMGAGSPESALDPIYLPPLIKEQEGGAS